jgi:ATP-dependent DNA helicase RecQ
MTASRLGNFVDQLIDLDLLVRSEGDYPTLSMSPAGAAVLRGEQRAVLRAPKEALTARSRRRRDSGGAAVEVRDLDAAELGLFESMRVLRRSIASELGVPPYVVFSDATLEELARTRPTTLAEFLHVKGVGNKKLESFGKQFLARIESHVEQAGMARPAAPPITAPAEKRPILHTVSTGNEEPRRAATSAAAAELFRRGVAIEEAAQQLGRATSTTWQYLAEWVEHESPPSLAPWIAPEIEARAAAALLTSEDGRLKPVFEALGGDVPYEVLRVVSARLRANGTAAE